MKMMKKLLDSIYWPHRGTNIASVVSTSIFHTFTMSQILGMAPQEAEWQQDPDLVMVDLMVITTYWRRRGKK